MIPNIECTEPLKPRLTVNATAPPASDMPIAR
jgi:hypothetical protein